MKKCKLILIGITMLSLLIVGCASGEKIAKADVQDVPDWVLNPPSAEDAIYAIGQSKKTNAALAQRSADLRAKQAISEQLSSKAKSMGQDVLSDAGMAGSITDITTSVVEILSKSELTGAAIIKRGIGKDGTWYSLCEYSITRAKNLMKDAFEKAAKEKENKLAKDKIEEMNRKIEEAFE